MSKLSAGGMKGMMRGMKGLMGGGGFGGGGFPGGGFRR
jgi:signal recognition particle subunit SRP54